MLRSSEGTEAAVWETKRAEKKWKGDKARKRGQRDSLGEASLSEARKQRGVPRVRFKLSSPGRARWQSFLGRRTVESSPEQLLGGRALRASQSVPDSR